MDTVLFIYLFIHTSSVDRLIFLVSDDLKFVCVFIPQPKELIHQVNNVVLQGLLGPKKELWDLFQLVEKWSYEAQDITASVRDLPTVK